MFFDTRTWKVQKKVQYKSQINTLNYDKTGQALFICEHNKVSVYNAQTLKSFAQLTGIHNNTKIECLKMHPDNEFFVTGAQDSLIAFWDFEDLICTGTLSDHNCQIKRLEFSPNGDKLAAVAFDELLKKHNLHVYSSHQRSPLIKPVEEDQAITCIAWHPDTTTEKPLLAYGVDSNKENVGSVALVRLEHKK